MKTPWLLAASADLARAVDIPGSKMRLGSYTLRVCRTDANLWLTLANGPKPFAALRLATAPDGSLLVERSPEGAYNVATSYGRLRVELSAPEVARVRVWLSPFSDLVLSGWPRDLLFLTDSGTIHTRQRGLRSGIVFASAADFGSMMYFQNYSSLCEYFTATGTSPADCVGGLWPEAGFTLPSNERRPLPAGREFQVSDASISLSPDVPVSDGSIASAYLDHFAAVYCALDRPEPEYHDWPHMAEQTILNLTYSDECRIEQRGRAYLAPYAGDKTKPPESMVQLTVLLPTYEYAAWSKTAVSFAEQIFRSLPSFFDAELNCFTRWPEGQCDPGPPDVRGSTRYADSWYIYHTLFNVARLVKRTHDTALRDLFRRSLGYARRVAHRFEYRFPVFFHLDTLEIFRAEAREGSGGENDVSGLYASVMLQAYDIFGEPEWLDEAERAADRLKGLGFNVGYQMNSTGFAADATLRLYFLTGRPEYLDLSYLCLANVLDNAWLWDCRYGNARAYSTFFGIFPLPDAPYLAAYEEMENSSKFREYLRIGGDDILPSVRLLLAEYCRHVLQRAWYYYPSNLPRQALAEHPKSGRIFADLAVPLEDLQEGWQKCGQVGQEIYGSGLAPALTVRHYAYLEALDCTLFCDYPAFGLRVSETTHPTIVKLSIAGDGRACCSIRVIPRDAARPAPSGTARVGRTTVSPTSTPQGHLLFRVPGGSTVRLLLSRR